MGQRLGRAALREEVLPLTHLAVSWILDRWQAYREAHPQPSHRIAKSTFVDLLVILHEKIYFNYHEKLTVEDKQRCLFQFKDELEACFTAFLHHDPNAKRRNSQDSPSNRAVVLPEVNLMEVVVAALLMSSSSAQSKVKALLEVLFHGSKEINATEMELAFTVVLHAMSCIDADGSVKHSTAAALSVVLTDRVYHFACRKRLYKFSVTELGELCIDDEVFLSWIHYYTRPTHWVQDAPPPAHTYWDTHLEHEVNRAVSVGFEAVLQRIHEIDDVVQRQRHQNAARILRLQDEIKEKLAENSELRKKIAITRQEINPKMPKDERKKRSDLATLWHYTTIRNERLVDKWKNEIKQVQRAATEKNTPLYKVMEQYRNYMEQIEKLNEQYQFQRAVNCPRDYLALNIAGDADSDDETDSEAPTMSAEYETPTNSMPNCKLELEWIYGFRGNDVRNNLAYLKTQEIVYTVATTAIVYSAVTDQQKFMSFHSQDIVSLAVHPGGTIVATGEDGADYPKIIVWSTQFVGQQCPSVLVTLRGAHTHPISFLAFSPSGHKLLTMALDALHTVKIYNWADGTVQFSAATDHRQVFGALWKSDVEFVTYGHSHIYFWQQIPRNTKAHSAFTRFHGLLSRRSTIQRFTSAALCCGPNSGYLLTGAADGRLYLWYERHLLSEVFGHYDQITVLRTSPDGFRVFSGCAVGKVIMWEISKREPRRLKNMGSLDLTSFGSFNSTIQSLDYRVVKRDDPPEPPTGKKSAALVAKQAQKQPAETPKEDLIILVGTAGCEVFEISTATGLDINSRPLVVTHRGDDAVALCAQRRIVCSGGDDGVLRLIDLDTHRVKRSVDLSNVISCVALAPNFPVAVAGIGIRTNPRPGGKEGVFYVISTDDMSCIYLGRDSQQCILAARFVPKGGQFVLASQDGCIYVYYIEYRKSHRDYKVWLRDSIDFGQGPCVHLDFSTNNKFLQVEVRDDDSLTSSASLIYVNFQAKDLAACYDEGAEWGQDIDMHTKWATWSCTCGWAVETVSPRYSDLMAVARTTGGEMFASTDQYGRLVLVRAPSLTSRPTRIIGFVHGSRATNVVCTDDDKNLLTIGGNDRTIVQWRIDHDEMDADMVSAVERTKVLRQEIIQHKQKLKSVKAALKKSLKPLIEERQFVQAKVNSWRQRVKNTMVPLEKYDGKNLVLGNLLRDQQRELERWMGPLSSVRKRIKAIQDMYSKEGSDVFNISRHIEALKRQLRFELKLMDKKRLNDLGADGVQLALEDEERKRGARRPRTAGSHLTAFSSRPGTSATFAFDVDEDSEEEEDRDAWESLPQRSFRVGDEHDRLGAPSATCPVRMAWVYGSNGTTGDTLAYGATVDDVIYTAASFPVILRKNMWRQNYLLEHAQPISCLSVHSKTNILATGQRGGPGFGGIGGVILVFDLNNNGELLRELSGFHSHGIAKVKFSRSGSLLLTLGAINNRIAVYDWRSHSVVAAVEGGNLPILDVSFTADANYFLQCGQENLKFHGFFGRNVTSQKALLGAEGTLQTFPCATCFGNFPIVGTEDGHLYQFGAFENEQAEPQSKSSSTRQGEEALAAYRQLRAIIPAHKGPVTALFACEAGLLSGGADGIVVQWSRSLKKARTFDMNKICTGGGPKFSTRTVTSVSWDGSSPRILVGLANGEIREVWQSPIGKAMDVNGMPLVDANFPRARGSGGGAASAFFQEASEKISRAMLAAAKKKETRRFTSHQTERRGPRDDVAAALCAHPSLPQFACVRQGLLQVFDCQTRRVVYRSSLERPGYCCAYSPDSNLIAVGLQGATVPPSDVGGEVHTVFVFGFPAIQESTSTRQRSKVSPAKSLFKLHSWRHGDRNLASSVTVCRFSPNGNFLLIGTDQGHIISYDARKGNNFQVLCKVKRTSLGYVYGMDFSECSNYVRVSDSVGNVAYLHLYRPTVIYVLRPARLPVHKIQWTGTTCAMEDRQNDPDDEDEIDSDDPFVPTSYIELNRRNSSKKVLVGAHPNGYFSVINSVSKSKFCKWSVTTSTATFGGHASRIVGLIATSDTSTKQRHVLSISKVHHCVIQWSVSPNLPTEEGQQGTELDDAANIDSIGTASWLDVKGLHEDRVATKVDDSQVDVVELSAKLIDSAFLPPKDYRTHPEMDWIYGESEACNLQLGASGSAVYSIGNNILQIRLPNLNNTLQVLSYTTNKVTESALSDDLQFLMTVELQTDVEVLGRFAERHGQPIVRIYGVRDATLRSSIRPNFKGPLIGVAMSPSGSHVAIVAGDRLHTLTIWQRRHLDWIGGAFIIARQLVGDTFVPNKLIYTPWYDLPLLLLQQFHAEASSHGSSNKDAAGRKSRSWQFWSYRSQNLSAVHTTFSTNEGEAKTTSPSTRAFAVDAQNLGKGNPCSAAMAGEGWTCAASFGDSLIIGTRQGLLLRLTCHATFAQSSADAVLRGALTNVTLIQDGGGVSSSQQFAMERQTPSGHASRKFDSPVCCLSQCNRAWIVAGDVAGTIRVFDRAMLQVAAFSVFTNNSTVVTRLSYDHSIFSRVRHSGGESDNQALVRLDHNLARESRITDIAGIAVAMSDGSAVLWTPESTTTSVLLPQNTPKSVICVAAHPSHRDLAVYGGVHEIGVWNLHTKRLVAVRRDIPGNVVKVFWAKSIGIVAILAREINASAPVSPRSSPSRPSSAFQSGQDEFAAGNIAILECAGDVAADHETLVAERPPPMLAVKHMATSPALNSGGRIHFVRSDEKSNLLFVAVGHTIEIYRKTPARSLDQLSVATMPKDLDPVSMYSNNQNNTICVLLSNESTRQFDVLSGKVMHAKTEQASSSAVALPTQGHKSPQRPSKHLQPIARDESGANGSTSESSPWVESWICLAFPGLKLAMMQLEPPPLSKSEPEVEAADPDDGVGVRNPTWHRLISQKVLETKEVRAVNKRLQTYRNLFAKMDVDGGGGVDFEELKVFCMTQFGETNDALLRMMFKEADEDGSGEIELDEFVHILKKMDYDDEVMNMDSSEAEILEEAGIEANIGTVEVQGESEFVDACINCDCSRILVVNSEQSSFKSWNIHSFERILKPRQRTSME